MSLASELAKLTRPLPKTINPDEDPFDSLDARSEYKEADSKVTAGDESEHQNEPKKHVKRGKLLREIDVGDKYKGRVVSRRALLDSDEDVSSDGNDAMALSSDDDDEEEERVMVPSAEEPEDENGSSSAEENTSDEDDMEEDSDAVVVRKPQTVDPEKVSKATKEQMKQWGSLIGLRIRLQPLMLKALELPTPEERQEIRSAGKGDVKEQLDTAASQLRSVLASLLEIRDVSAEQSPFFNTKVGKKRSRKALETDGAAWRTVCEDNEESRDFYNEAFDRWHLRNVHASTISGKKLKALNQSISSQVEQVMSSGRDLKRRSQLSPVRNGTKSGDDSFNPEVYNDSDFYQQLLREYVATAGVESAKSSGNLKGINGKLKKSKKTGVDLKASKGRRLRYTVHEKLVSFVTPKEKPESTINVDQLFRSLFT